jgi:hypothetical protein
MFVTKYGEDTLTDLTGKQAQIDKIIDLKKINNKNQWLEEGYNKLLPNGKWIGQGWAHIKEKHITGTIPGGDIFPSRMNENDVKNFIYDAIQKNQGTKQGIHTIFTQNLPPPDGRLCKVIVEDGKIITAYPIGKI